jgi:hypothetical protein
MCASRVLGVVGVLGLLAAAAPAAATGGPGASFHVAVDGDDAAAGTEGRPFRTLQRALQASRKASRDGDADIVIVVHDGTHRLTRPLVLDARDSGPVGHALVIRAARGASPVLSGAIRVQGWTLHDPALHIYRADVPPGLATRQLYVDGVRAVRARTPDYPPGFLVTPTGYLALLFEPAPATWTNVRDVEAVTVGQWKGMRCPVGSVDGAFITMRNPCWKNANVFQAPQGEDPLWSFHLLARFENAYAFLDEPGEWYLDARAGALYYIPRPGEDLATADVELPVLETLVEGRGTRGKPVERVRFEHLTFAYATWLRPSTADGYVADQSGFHLVGWDHAPNVIGHARHVARTPGNLRFVYARRIAFVRNRFLHLGGVGLDFDTGAQRNVVVGNRFEDISSAGIQIGGVDDVDHHPPRAADWARDNRVTDNLVLNVGREFIDAAGIYVGFAARTLVRHNDVDGVPWSGIALGWGWGLYDPGSFPGLPNATSGEWGTWRRPTASRGNRVLQNRIRNFLQEVWDGGAVYTQGRQGGSYRDGELIAGNVASNKRPSAGGNTFYTDGGSRYVTLAANVSYDDPQGVTDFGPCDTLSALPLCWLKIPYGSDRGGCIPYGDIRYRGNYWQTMQVFFYDVCSRPPYPVDVSETGEHFIGGAGDVPARILKAAGRRRAYRD